MSIGEKPFLETIAVRYFCITMMPQKTPQKRICLMADHLLVYQHGLKDLNQKERVTVAKMTVATVNTRIESHEAVCAERWLEIIHRVKRVEHFIVATLITLVVGMAGIIFS